MVDFRVRLCDVVPLFFESGVPAHVLVEHDAVLDLSGKAEFARPLVNSGRLSVPCTYDGSKLNGPDTDALPERTRVGAPMVDAPVDDDWLLELLGGEFQLMTIDADAPDNLNVDGIEINRVALSAEGNPELLERYLGDAVSAVYLLRPDQHVAARWERFNEKAVREALNIVSGRV